MMKNLKWVLASLALLGCNGVALGQADKPAAPRMTREVMDSWVTQIEKLVTPAADAMQEDKFSFAPSDGEFKGVRTFAEQVKHLAAANYQLGAGVLGEDPPAGTKNETAPDSVKTKAEIMAYLKGSFAVLHRAANSIDEKNMNEPIAKMRNRTRMWLVIDAVAHSSNHYGQMVEYLRM
ncbi:MAG: DinB family protein, partial [Candidatus Acidiferrales bacterium]